MAGAINIVIGANVTPFIQGMKAAQAASNQFATALRADFKGLSDLMGKPNQALTDLTQGLRSSRINTASITGSSLVNASSRSPLIAPDLLAGAGGQFRELGQMGRKAGESLTGSFSGLAGQIGRTGAALSGLPGQFNQISAAASLLGPLGGLFAVDKILSFGQAITTTSGQFEKFESILTNALGSRTLAQSSLAELTDFATTTPNQLDELTRSFIKFVNRGITPTRQQLTSFGDLAASQGKGFDQLTEAILDAQSGEFERLKEFGIRASKSGDQVSLSFKGVTQTVAITAASIGGAIEKFGQLGGVQGSMAAISQTLQGQVSNLSDAYDRLLVALGDSGISGGYKAVLNVAGQFLSTLTNLIATSPADSLRQHQTALNGLVGAITLANDNEAVRLDLIGQLNQQYPEFLGRLDAESVSNDVLARRLADVNGQYEQKIRLALGQERIKAATDELTASIRQQGDALQSLAKASGKSIVELEKLDAKGRINLARDLARRESQFGAVPGGGGLMLTRSPMNQVGDALEAGAKKQAAAQAQLNGLMQENATRQAELTRTSVAGYQAQINQIREKIRLKQIEASVGQAEIKRLNEQIRITQGKPVVTQAASTSQATKALKVPQEVIDSYAGPLDALAVWRRTLQTVQDEVKKLREKGEFINPKLLDQIDAVQQKIAELEKQADAFKNRVIDLPVRLRLETNAETGNFKLTDQLLPSFNGQAVDLGLSGLTNQLGGYQTGLRNILAKEPFGRAPALPGLDAMKEKWQQQTAAFTVFRNNLNAIPDAFSGLKGQLAKGYNELNKDVMEQARLTTAIIGGGFKALAESLKAQVPIVFSSAFESIGLGDLSPLKNALKGILGIISSYAIQIGTALLFSGTALAGASFATFGATLPLGINQKIAGAGLIAAGGLVKGLSARAFALGGIAYGPTVGLVGEYAGARTNPEVIAPLNKLKDLIRPATSSPQVFIARSVVRGSDLLTIYERAQKARDY